MDEQVPRHDAQAAERAWDEVAPIHRQHRYNQLLEGFRKPGFVAMPRARFQLLRAIPFSGKAAFQPCCNNGRDILSLKNMGAGRCLGFDISREFIQDARDFAAAGGIDCEFLQCDVYDVGPQFDAQFDICLISLGTFMWMPDLAGFFSVMSRLLRSPGRILIHEFHPVDEIVDDVTEHTISFKGNYFENDGHLWTKGLDYFGGKAYDATPTHRFLHKISDIIQSLIDCGFVIETFTELQDDMRNGVFNRGMRDFPLPRSYTLTAVQP